MSTMHLSRTDIYENLTPIYERLHARFLRLAGGSAQDALTGAITALLKPKQTFLDAGCGTGRLARRMRLIEPSLRISLLDAAPAMLRSARSIPARRVHGSLETLPFADGSFDLTVCAWAIEATMNEQDAVVELLRVTRTGGHLCIAFCAETQKCDPIDRFMIEMIKWRGTGRFLIPELVEQRLRECGIVKVRRIDCDGPAVVLLVEKYQ